ncbi:FliO/MopB family protein [Comamonas nitrativorans]|uniref:FliO/MopB family protein n=1 Tax=Comamonas nitrativorans TaxID=108437 RepID=A0ABV9GUK6_9BURK
MADSLSTSLLVLVAMVIAMAALPWGLRRWQLRRQVTQGVVQVQTQVLGAVAIGPGQRVVTVQVQRGDAMACLVLGVTAQSIQCLHVLPDAPAASSGATADFAQALVTEQGKD